MKVKVYEWLKGDGNAYIDTNIMPSQSLEWEIKAQVTYTDKRDECLFGARNVEISSSNGSYVAWFNTFYTYPSYDFRAFDKQGTANVKLDNEPHIFSLKDSIGYCDGNVVKTYDTSAFYDLGVNIGLFALIRNDYVDVRRFSGRISYFKTDTLHLVPCLTEDGEACMINLLTGDLYFNQGTGAFSVEGEMLYEFETPAINRIMKKPGIVVRLRESINFNRGYIDTKIQSTPDIKINMPFKADSIITWGNILGVEDETNDGKLRIGNGGEATPANSITFVRRNYYQPSKVLELGKWYKMDIADNVIYFDDEKFTDVQILQSTNTIALGALNRFKNFSGGCNITFGVTTINDTTFHPCDLLLHPTLPPQSCMIDLKTGTLYTNQGTGSFTCEGADLGIWTDTMAQTINNKVEDAMMVVCKNNGIAKVVYEKVQPFVEHKWLIQTNPNQKAMIETNYKPSKNVEVDAIYCVPNVVPSDACITRRAAYDSSDKAFNLFADVIQYGNSTSPNLEKGIRKVKVRYPNVYCNDVLVITDELGVIESSKTIRLMSGANGFPNANYLGDVRFGNDLHLTPCQLTRPLLPSEIASSNSALRGECGFCDKEKYKAGLPWFYGNISSNGSFSVSDED